MATGNHSSVPEGFKEIPGFDGKYFINQEGQVWSTYRNRILSQHLDATKRYLQSLMMMPGRKTGIPRYIHKLVAIAWLGNAPGEVGCRRGQWCVNHKDGNKLNNHASNLEWVTVEDNAKHAWRNGLNTQVGETSTSSTLTSAKVREIRLRLVQGEPAVRIAKDYGVGKNCIDKLRMYVNWKHQDHDLVVPMMKISNSVNLKAFYETLLANQVPAVAHQEVEQVAPNSVVADLATHRACKRDYHGWWHYSI
jgi:hypothetical protein